MKFYIILKDELKYVFKLSKFYFYENHLRVSVVFNHAQIQPKINSCLVCFLLAFKTYKKFGIYVLLYLN